MENHVCRFCGANNPEAGTCIVCSKDLGSKSEALKAAAWSTTAMICLWLIVAVVFNLQFPIVAATFGGVVAICTSRFSGGRGLFYQSVATVATIVGIIAADALAMIAFSEGKGLSVLLTVTPSQWMNEMAYRWVHDPYTCLFFVVGVLGSLIIWK